MLIDLDKKSELPHKKYKLCIVGAGAVGISIACEFLAEGSMSLAIVESGTQTENSHLNDLDKVVNFGDVDSGVAGSRKRGVGGSTQIWGGQALPFSAIDFSPRPQIRASGWPINEADLKPYYQQVEQLFNVPSPSFEDDIWAKDSTSHHDRFKTLAQQHELKLHFSKFSPMPNFASAHATPLYGSKHIDLIINANVLEFVESDQEASIDYVVIRNSKGDLDKLYADVFILCAGGIENPRLLLNSKSKSLNGVGNDLDMVGRFFQDHLGFYGARLEPLDFAKFNRLFATRIDADVKCLPKLSLSESAQEKLGTLNITGNIEVQTGDESPLTLMRSSFTLLKNRKIGVELFRSILKLLRSPFELASAAYSFLFEKRIYIPKKAQYFLVANIESESISDSRIRLSEEVDSYGMARADVDWQLSDHSRLAALAYYSNLKNYLEAQNIAKVIIKDVLFNTSNDWKQHCYSLYHHMGATRMSEIPSQGVVDQNCKVHELQNLYLAGTSVLPTGGASNPTFTALALALRLVDHIKHETDFL